MFYIVSWLVYCSMAMEVYCLCFLQIRCIEAVKKKNAWKFELAWVWAFAIGSIWPKLIHMHSRKIVLLFSSCCRLIYTKQVPFLGEIIETEQFWNNSSERLSNIRKAKSSMNRNPCSSPRGGLGICIYLPLFNFLLHDFSFKCPEVLKMNFYFMTESVSKTLFCSSDTSNCSC